MPSALKRLTHWLYAPVILFSAIYSGNCHTYHQSGVESNFLVDDEKVIFAQSDGSLTVLNLKTGVVLARNRSGDFSGSLRKTESGVLALRYSSVSLLDSKMFNVIWQMESQYDASLVGNRIVSQDGNGVVQCRRLRDGAILWSYELPGALDVVGKNGSVLVHRAATYDENTPTTTLVDLETGKEIFRKVPPAKTHWESCYFDGANIYVKAGVFEEVRSDFKITEMLVWNTRGEEIEQLPIEPELAKKLRFGDSPFELVGKTFWKGNVYSGRSAIRSERLGKILPISERDGDSDFWHEAYQLNETTTIKTRSRRGFDDRENDSTPAACEIEVETENGTWRGTLSYMPPYGRVAAAARLGDKVLIGSNFGHVECIEATTGKSIWPYVFPTYRSTTSYSSHGMPPMMADAARTFRRENANPPTRGFELSVGKRSAPRIILDPQPMNPFKNLSLYLAIAWAGAGIPLLTIGFVIQNRNREKANSLSGILLMLCLVSFFVFQMFGRVSVGSSIALRIAIIVSIVFGSIYATKSLRLKRTIGTAALLGCFIGLAFYFFPFLFRL